ncbi:flavin reductase family protein [Arthrobacter sp. VKM Ac-2550]|uniref:flavin reductase family protein n=1 Tax=Crystallibacter permensis TaxID=1938888 RepID=UPI0022270B86|nr:flavin reductase family protein [Arthrobacter sp. VKM Ac-2550]
MTTTPTSNHTNQGTDPETGKSGKVGIDQELFRETVGRYASGITIITSHDSQGPIGFTCQSFYSVSVEPPLVSFSVMKTSTTYPRIRETGTFAVNVLSQAQEVTSRQFARRGADKWAGISWNPTNDGNPVLDGSLAWLDCRIQAEHDAADHIIVIGHVVQLGTTHDQRLNPLLYFQGQYRALDQHQRPHARPASMPIPENDAITRLSRGSACGRPAPASHPTRVSKPLCLETHEMQDGAGPVCDTERSQNAATKRQTPQARSAARKDARVRCPPAGGRTSSPNGE